MAPREKTFRGSAGGRSCRSPVAELDFCLPSAAKEAKRANLPSAETGRKIRVEFLPDITTCHCNPLDFNQDLWFFLEHGCLMPFCSRHFGLGHLPRLPVASATVAQTPCCAS